jgi:hypothetical protein
LCCTCRYSLSKQLKESKEEEISKLLEKYPLGKLQHDLLSFVEQKKTTFQSTFLEQVGGLSVVAMSNKL